MSSVTAPPSLRVLIAWPESDGSALRRALIRGSPKSDVTCTDVSVLSHHLSEPGFYHVLYLRLADWRALPTPTRQKFARRVTLLILGPEPASPTDVGDVGTCLYFTAELRIAEAVTSLAEMHSQLMLGWALSRCAAESQGRLALLGPDDCWPEGKAEVDAPSSTSLARNVPRSGVLPAGVGIGEMHVAGDVVYGPKTIHHAEGDQVIRAEVSGGKLVQQAGGDQSNVNRLTGDVPEITQTTQGDQVNVNSMRVSGSQNSRTCPTCQRVARAEDKFCEHCGGRLP